MAEQLQIDRENSYINSSLEIIEEKPETESYYQELNDYHVQIPPNPHKLAENVQIDADDYHDSVEFADLSIPSNRPTSPLPTVTAIEPQKQCDTKTILLIATGIILFVIMIVIIGVLASHLVTDNDKQAKRLHDLELKLTREKKLLEDKINSVKNNISKNEAAKLATKVINLEKELKKLKKTITEIHCGKCNRTETTILDRGYYCDCRNLKAQRDCLQFHQSGFRTNALYKIHQNHRKTISVYCDQTTDGGGWTVIQRRRDGSVNFDLNWQNYKAGFGNLEKEHWLGNDNIFTLTLQSASKDNELRVELEDWDGVTKVAKYGVFKIDDETKNFKLLVSGYSGLAGDSLTHSSSMQFTTKDKDNDRHDTTNCGQYHKGGWWFKHCSFSNLNGKYHQQGTHDDGIFWKAFKGVRYSLKTCEMKLRRKV